jgi:hypothetical protein
VGGYEPPFVGSRHKREQNQCVMGVTVADSAAGFFRKRGRVRVSSCRCLAEGVECRDVKVFGFWWGARSVTTLIRDGACRWKGRFRSRFVSMRRTFVVVDSGKVVCERRRERE